MKVNKLTMAVVALLGWCAIGQQAFSQQVLSLDLNQAIELALNENPTIKIANQEIARQKWVRKEAQGALMPNLSASGSYTYNIMNPVMFMPSGGPFGEGGALRMGFNNGFVGGFSLSLPLYMPTLYKMLQLTDNQMMAAVEAARGSKVSLVNQVQKGYYAILLAENSVGVIRDNISLAELIVNDTRNAYDQGAASEYDLVTAQVQLDNLKPTLIQAENGIRNSRLMFNMLLSLPVGSRVELTQTLEDYSGIVLNDTLSSIDLSRNVDLNTIEIQKGLLQKQVELQRAQRIPTLAAVAQYQVQSQSNDFRIGKYQWRGSALAGIQLSVPIFSGLSPISKQRQLENQVQQIATQRDYLEESLNVEAQTALSNLTRAREQMLATISARGGAEKGYKIAKTRYDVGAGTIVELNSAQMSLLQSNLSYSQSIYDYMSARADFEKVLGSPEIVK